MFEDLVIDETNFHEYFKDVRRHVPEKGQVMACYSAIAEFGPGAEKTNLVDLLINTDKVIPATQVMRKIMGAIEADAVRVCREIVQDLLSGMTREEVIQKTYKYTLRMHYYTFRDLVPTDDPHWTIVEIIPVSQRETGYRYAAAEKPEGEPVKEEEKHDFSPTASI